MNKYMDLFKEHPDTLLYKAKAERYAKIISKTIITAGMGDANFGQNQFFYDAAEGLLTAAILLVAEFCAPRERHIVSVFKVIQELMGPGQTKGQTQFQELLALLPETHKAKWFAGAATSTSDQAMASVMSTALARLNAFLDSEMEQLLCFDTAVDAETFCKEKSALFLVMPRGGPQQILHGVADYPAALPGDPRGGGRTRREAAQPGGVLRRRVWDLCDTFAAEKAACKAIKLCKLVFR